MWLKTHHIPRYLVPTFFFPANDREVATLTFKSKKLIYLISALIKTIRYILESALLFLLFTFSQRSRKIPPQHGHPKKVTYSWATAALGPHQPLLDVGQEMTMGRADLCTDHNHSNGVHQNLLVLNFSPVCSNVSSAAIPVRNLLCLYLPWSRWWSIDYWQKKLSKSGYADKHGCMCGHVYLWKMHIHMHNILMHIQNGFMYIAPALTNISITYPMCLFLINCWYLSWNALIMF